MWPQHYRPIKIQTTFRESDCNQIKPETLALYPFENTELATILEDNQIDSPIFAYMPKLLVKNKHNYVLMKFDIELGNGNLFKAAKVLELGLKESPMAYTYLMNVGVICIKCQ